MAEVTIEATPNGPYLVTGPVELRDTDGTILPTKGKVWLCRAVRRPRSRCATAPIPRLASKLRPRRCPRQLK